MFGKEDNMTFKIRTTDGYEVERDHYTLATEGLVIDGSVYGPAMIEWMKPVEEPPTEKEIQND